MPRDFFMDNKLLTTLKNRKLWPLFALVILLSPLLLSSAPPMPPGTNVTGPERMVRPGDIELLVDHTAWSETSKSRVISQEIFDQILTMIVKADRFIVLDMFLWNPWQGSIPEEHRQVSSELAAALMEKKKTDPEIPILVLTDPINRVYGAMEPAFYREMTDAGLTVVFTDLSKMPDSNRFYAPYWNAASAVLTTFPFRGAAEKPRFENPFVIGGEQISLMQVGKLLRFKANHRKVLITGSETGGLEMLVGSFNPADGSSAHSNLALKVSGSPVLDGLDSELSVIRWSGSAADRVIGGPPEKVTELAGAIAAAAEELADAIPGGDNGPRVQWISEGAITTSIVQTLETAGEGDHIRMAIFYLSIRPVVKAIKQAAANGAEVRVIMDANRDAFGRKKVGIPNRQVAAELSSIGVEVRWADTHGEQFHSKALSITNGTTGKELFMTGSANWTRRNIGNLNLEANLLLKGATAINEQFNHYFDTAWENGDGLSHTLPYSRWESTGPGASLKKLRYRFQEWSGLSTF
jgi:hypothetical protein